MGVESAQMNTPYRGVHWHRFRFCMVGNAARPGIVPFTDGSCAPWDTPYWGVYLQRLIRWRRKESMALPDYYQILGVTPTAGIAEIKKAYRKLALENHPDLGGSHERMLAINEAFFVLIDPVARPAYDESRSANASAFAKKQAAEFSNKAAGAAGDYPKSFKEFDGWLTALLQDFANARYGSDGGGCWHVPTAQNSTSGALFILIGAVAGGYLGWKLVGASLEGGPRAFAVAFVAIGGAWLGQLLHRAVRSTMVDGRTATQPSVGSTPAPQAAAPAVVPCPQCGQQLGVTNQGQVKRLRCPQCGTEFTL